MPFVYYAANSRGYANHQWLKTYHSFSFASYFNRERMHFGALRVLNDDYIAGGMGFDMHPHDNMEIITIPLKGALQHKDSMGHSSIIKSGEIQGMSAGTGIYHSEFNASSSEAVELLQIWIIPHTKNVTPSYQQINITTTNNAITTIVSPIEQAISNTISIYQNAWFSIAKIDEGKEINYHLHNPQNGVYIFVIDGSVTANNNNLQQRDALGVWNVDTINLQAIENSEILLIETTLDIG